MLELAQSSEIGVGVRRLPTGSAGERTLAAALDRGCTLVDVHEPDAAAVEPLELGVGRVLARRLDPVTVLASCTDLHPSALVHRVRVGAARLRRDRLDVLLLTVAPLHRPSDDALRAAVATCEQLADRGELGTFGLRLAATDDVGAAAAEVVARVVALAREVRAWSRLSVLQLPCTGLAGQGGPDDVAAVAHRCGLQVVGTDPLPVRAAGTLPSSTCRAHLRRGADHLVVDPAGEEQLRAVQDLLPLRQAA